MGIDPEDVASVYRINYEGLDKTAQVEGGTYLEKTASIADSIASGDLSDIDDIVKVAVANDISIEDIEAIYNTAYEADHDLDKTAALNNANEILANQQATYLEKTAVIADMYERGIVSSEDATQAAESLGISVDDVNALLPKSAIFGLGKAFEDAKAADERLAKGDKKKTWDAIKDRAGKMKDGVVDAGKNAGKWVGDNKGKSGAVGAALLAAGGGTAYALKKREENRIE